MSCTAIHVAVTLEHRLCLMCTTALSTRPDCGDFWRLSDHGAGGWGAHTTYIHEILIAILKWTHDDIKISLYNRENAALKSQVTRVGLAHARPIMYNRVLHSQHTMNVHTLCIRT